MWSLGWCWGRSSILHSREVRIFGNPISHCTRNVFLLVDTSLRLGSHFLLPLVFEWIVWYARRSFLRCLYLLRALLFNVSFKWGFLLIARSNISETAVTGDFSSPFNCDVDWVFCSFVLPAAKTSAGLSKYFWNACCQMISVPTSVELPFP